MYTVAPRTSLDEAVIGYFSVDVGTPGVERGRFFHRLFSLVVGFIESNRIGVIVCDGEFGWASVRSK